MPRYNDMSDSDSRREEARHFQNDVFYEVWRSGRDTDRIDYDRVNDRYWDGSSSEEAAAAEIHAQRNAEQRATEEEEQRLEYERMEYERMAADSSPQQDAVQ